MEINGMSGKMFMSREMCEVVEKRGQTIDTLRK
jgi:hypothetical protein